MKIVFPIGSFYPAQSGGPNNTIYWLAKQLVKVGYEIVVVTTNTGIKPEHKIELDKWLDLDGIKVIYCTTKFHQLPVKMLLKSLGQMRKADVVHLNSIFYMPSFLLGLWSLITKKRVVWSARGELIDSAFSFSTGRKKFLLGILKPLLNKKIVFHGTSDVEVESIKKRIGKSSVVAENYMELPAKFEEQRQNQFLFLGRIHPLKCLNNLISAFAESEIAKKEGYRLKLVGYEDKPGYVQELTDLIRKLGTQERIQFSDPLSGDEKFKEYAKSKFKVLVSGSENFGNVVVEALSQGTPVIASKGTPWNKLETAHAGFWINNDIDSIKYTIEKAIALDADSYELMCKNAAQMVAENYDVANKYVIWTDIYQNLMKAHG